MTTCYAKPYNLDAIGFYFDSMEAFTSQSENLTDHYGQPVEEFEIQYINGDDAQLFTACGINQANLDVWFDEVEPLTDHQKAALFCLCDMGYALDAAMEKLDDVCLSQCGMQDVPKSFLMKSISMTYRRPCGRVSIMRSSLMIAGSALT